MLAKYLPEQITFVGVWPIVLETFLSIHLLKCCDCTHFYNFLWQLATQYTQCVEKRAPQVPFNLSSLTLNLGPLIVDSPILGNGL